MTKILITKNNEFVDNKLVIDLLNQGYQIYALCLIKRAKFFAEDGLNLHVHFFIFQKIAKALAGGMN